MKIVFDRETQIGICDQDWVAEECPKPANGEPWVIFANTMAELTHARGMVKIDHRCFVRSGPEIADFPSVRPDMTLEVAPDSEDETIRMVEQLHEKFVDLARQHAGSDCTV